METLPQTIKDRSHCPSGQGGLATSFRTGIITDIAGLDAIAPAWRALEIRAADPLTYFQSYNWCRTWCAFYVPEAGNLLAPASGSPAIRICTVWRDETLVAVWPLMAFGGKGSVHRLMALTEPLGQYGNILVDPQFRRSGALSQAIDACWQNLCDDDGADVITLDNVPATALPDAFCPAPQRIGSIHRQLKTVCTGASAAFDLTGFASFEDYRSKLKSSTRRARNKRRNKLATLGKLTYVVRVAGEAGYTDLIRQGLTMKRRWLNETGRATRALNLPNVTEFLAALTNEPNGESGAIAAALMLDGKPVAVEIGFLWHRRCYSWLGSFEWDLRDYSPGKVQLEEAIGWCIGADVTDYDLLGDPTTYKSDWSNGTDRLYSWRAAPTLRGRAYLSVWNDRLLPAMKQALAATPPGLRARLIPLAERRSAPTGMTTTPTAPNRDGKPARRTASR